MAARQEKTQQLETQQVTETVGNISDFAVGQMKMTQVGGTPVAVVRTESGVHALDNACPHQGYGLVTGSLDGELLTCQWHNWKFRVSDGVCVVGEEDVACHQVAVDDDGSVAVTIERPTAEQAREKLWPSLDRGFDNNYPGQMARDTVRLLHNGAQPAEIVARQLVRSQAREEYGVGHGLAMAADCLALTDLYDGDEQALPVVQSLSAMAEPTRFRPDVALVEADPSATVGDLIDAIEAEDVDRAVAATRGLLASGASAEDMLEAYAETVARHHLSYGHGAIYTQKCFEMLEYVGWGHAPDLLPHLTISLTYATREDTLPYMRKAAREINAVDVAALAHAEADGRWTAESDQAMALRKVLLDSPEAAIASAVEAAHNGAGVIGVIDAVSLAVSERLLRYDSAIEYDNSVDFGWLDITHGVTYANAARWMWNRLGGEAAARLALYTVFLCHDSGRAERRNIYAGDESTPAGRPGDLTMALADGRADDAVAHALAGDPVGVGDALARMSLTDRSTSWIVTAHVVKLAQAARVEAAATGSSLPLAASSRFTAAPRMERFVAANVAEALQFVRTGAPPKR